MFAERLTQDISFGLRQLRRTPGFTLVAIATLALGVGANTFVFSLVHAVLLTPPPYPHPKELVSLHQDLPGMGEGHLGTSPSEYLDYRDRNRSFVSLAGYETFDVDLLATGSVAQSTERIKGVRATGNLFSTLEISPQLGRAFSAGDDRLGAGHVALLSAAMWEKRYNRNPGILGTAITLNEQSFVVIGVMPDGFTFPESATGVGEQPSVWVPMAYTQKEITDRAASFDTFVVGRLQSGVSVHQAVADVNQVAAAFELEHPDIYNGNVRIVPAIELLGADLGSGAATRAQPILVLLTWAVGFVLLIACANVAGLLLARAGARRREIAVRGALGASRSRIASQVVTESLLLSFSGGAIGVLLAAALASSSAKLWSSENIGSHGIYLNGTVLLFTLAISVLTGVVCSLAPLRSWTRSDIGEALKQSGRGVGYSRTQSRFRSGLVVAETASAVILLVSAGLLIASFLQVLRTDPGFRPGGVLIVRTSFNRERYPDTDRRRAAEQLILARIRALPGVTAVALATHIPLADDRQIGFSLEGAPVGEAHWADNALISGDYFAAMGIPLLAGRTFTSQDVPQAPGSAIVNRAMARRYWPGSNPLGQRLVWGGRRLTIVGIVGDVHLQALDAPAQPAVYTSVFQLESGAATSAVFVIRGDAPALASLASTARKVIASVDHGLSVFSSTSLNQVIQNSLASRRFSMQTLAAFAGVALSLAAVGLYGLLAYTVTQRTQEMGVRIALGAEPLALAKMVLSSGLRLTMGGVIIGIVASSAATRIFSGLLFGVTPLDPSTYLASAGLLIAVALVASYLPARRASRVDPIISLRYE